MTIRNAGMVKDNFLRNVVIGFGIVTVVLVTAVILLNAFGPKTEYNDFEQVGNYALASQQEEDVYAVYFYSETCGACISIKGATMGFGNKNALDIPLYLMDSENTAGLINVIVGPGGETLQATPTMLVYKNGQIISFFQNAEVISDFYENVENGNYTLD